MTFPDGIEKIFTVSRTAAGSDVLQYIRERSSLPNDYELVKGDIDWIGPKPLYEHGITEQNNRVSLRKRFITTDPHVTSLDPQEVEDKYLFARSRLRKYITFVSALYHECLA